MKYKVGDIIRIKTWEAMEKEYGLKENKIQCELTFSTYMEKQLTKRFLDRTVMIKEILGNRYYGMFGTLYSWSNDMIEGLDPKNMITSRFEILDIR